MKIDGSRILVTGANGFIGGWLSRTLLNEGAEVIGLARHPKNNLVLKLHRVDSEVKLQKADITSYKSILGVFKAAQPDAVVHLAAQSSARVMGNDMETFRVNIDGTVNALNACLACGVENVVVASTWKVYEKQEKKIVDEDDTLEANSVYAVSKTIMDVTSRAFAQTHNLNLAVTRCANVFGPIDLSTERLIPSTALKVFGGERPTIYNKSAKRDFIYAGDVAQAYLKILERIEKKNVRCNAFNIASGKQRKVTEAVQKIIGLCGSKIKPLIKSPPLRDGQEPVFSVKKAAQALGWKAETPFNEGLKRTVEWIGENKALYLVK